MKDCKACGVRTEQKGECGNPCAGLPKWKRLSQYMTDPPLANRMAVWMGADAPFPITVVDPTCGNGALLAPWVQRGHEVTGVDIDPDMVGAVLASSIGRSMRAEVGDYTKTPAAALAMFNPPYERQMDAKVIADVMTRVDRGCALVRLDCLSTQYFTEAVFAVARPKRIAHLRYRPVFHIPEREGPSHGAQRPFVVLDLVREPDGFAGGTIETEWWSR